MALLPAWRTSSGSQPVSSSAPEQNTRSAFAHGRDQRRARLDLVRVLQGRRCDADAGTVAGDRSRQRAPLGFAGKHVDFGLQRCEARRQQQADRGSRRNEYASSWHDLSCQSQYLWAPWAPMLIGVAEDGLVVRTRAGVVAGVLEAEAAELTVVMFQQPALGARVVAAVVQGGAGKGQRARRARSGWRSGSRSSTGAANL